MRQNDITSITLVDGLKNADDRSWDRFYSLYAPMVVAYAKQRGCSETMCDDVLQETIVALFKTVPNFEYDIKKGRFRSYVFRIASSKIIDAYRRNKRIVSLDSQELLDALNEGSHEKTEALHETWDSTLLNLAIESVKKKVLPKTFEVFFRTFVKGEPVPTVATELQIEPNSVYQSRHKVKTLIIQEAQRIKNEFGE